MQNTGKSTETAWNVDLQNMKRQVPGRAGQTDRKEETERPETAKNRTAPAPGTCRQNADTACRNT